MVLQSTPQLDVLVERIRRRRPALLHGDAVRPYYVNWALHQLAWDEILTLCDELAPDVPWSKSTDSLEEAFARLLEFQLRLALLGVITMRSETPDDVLAFNHWCDELRRALREAVESWDIWAL